ncbi:MAG TPA: hypothetical protein VGJ63_15935 [Micromonosporaceae bacterium]
MIAGRFEITIDEVDELVEAIAMRTAGDVRPRPGRGGTPTYSPPTDPDAPDEPRRNKRLR